MKKVNWFISLGIALLLFSACARKQYAVKSVSGYLVEMNSDRDAQTNPKMIAFVDSYKNRLGAEMSEIIGDAAQTLTKSGQQQSLLTNFTADAMQDYATGAWGSVDFAVINAGGLRSSLNKGTITIGNLYEIYAFENRLVLVELPGKAVKELFDFFAGKRMEGISKNIRLVIKNKAVESLTIKGQPFDENKIYRVVTVDYLAEGNDGMEAFIQATQHTDSNVTLRDTMIEHVRKLTTENKLIDAKPDDRVKTAE